MSFVVVSLQEKCDPFGRVRITLNNRISKCAVKIMKLVH